jgi:hypothetical protein
MVICSKKVNKRWIWVAYDPVHQLVIAYYTNPFLKLPLSIEENFLLFEAFFKGIALVLDEKNNEEE